MSNKNDDWTFKVQAPKKNQSEEITKTDTNTMLARNRAPKLTIENKKPVRASTRTALYNELKKEQDEKVKKDVIVYPSIQKRAIALVLDLALWVGLFLFAKQIAPMIKGIVLNSINNSQYQYLSNLKYLEKIILASLFFIFYFLLDFYPTRFYNTSPGKRLLGLRVRGMENFTLTTEQAFMREFVFRPIAIFTGIGLIIPLLNENNRSLHDFIVQTQVVED